MSDFKLSTALLVLFSLAMCPVLLQADDYQPYPIEEWAKRASTSNISLSPDGDKIAMLRINKVGENPILEVYNSSDLSARPFRMDADPMEITGASWVSDNELLFYARQKVRDKIDGFNRGVYEYSGGLLSFDRGTKKSKYTRTGRIGRIASLLPKSKNKVIVSTYEGVGGAGVSYYPSYYEYDFTKNKRGRLVLRENPKARSIRFDAVGNPRLASSYDSSSDEFISLHRAAGSSKWVEINRTSRDSFETWSVMGFDPANSEDLLVLAHNGMNTAGLWAFDTSENKLTELVYHRKDVDVGIMGSRAVRTHSNSWENPQEITALYFFKDGERQFEWFNPEEEAVYKQLEATIPHSYRLSITSRSRDGDTMIISNSGPRDPGTDYLLKNGKLSVLGSSKPGLASDKLADVKSIWYKSRHGEMVNGYITIPNSEPPYPLVVMPHGGPFVQETIGFDEWSQMLANNGFMVLQPQYRGSLGRGLDFYKTAFINGAQGGYQMQDDKDDGALYLADQGLVERDRMMMFGWSYGGYAALVAASRTPQIYQCVIAGATVPDPNDQLSYYRNQMASRPSSGSVEQLSFWDGSLHPIKEVAKVNVPMLIVHGTVDQRTPPRAARAYIEALKENDKEHKSLWLEGADHFSNTLFYNHKMELYSAMTDYLENDCFAEKQNLASN
jgi:dipeptidyl aminopeptidase/acylaminoacyl peptidase